MILIYGKRLYGRVDRVPGLLHVATQFIHLFWVPLVPLKSYVVFDGTEDDKGFRGIPIGISVKSLLTGWLRAVLALGLLGLLGLAGMNASEYLDRAADARPPLGSILGPLAGAFGCFVLLRLWTRFSRADVRRARELAEKAGLDPGALEARVLARPAPPSGPSRLQKAAGLLGALLLGAGAAGHAGLLPLPNRFRDVDLQEVRRLLAEHRYSMHFDYVRLQAPVELEHKRCFAWNGEPAAPADADRCLAPVGGAGQDLYAKLKPAAAGVTPPLTAVLISTGDAFLNKALGREFGNPAGVLDLEWGENEADRIRVRSLFLLGGGGLLLALALLWRFLP
jgi:hypothetical protein